MRLSLLFLLFVAQGAVAQRKDFAEYQCYFDFPEQYEMPPFEDMTSVMPDYSSKEAMLNFEKFYLSGSEEATYGLSVAFGAPKTANTFTHDTIFSSAITAASGISPTYLANKIIDGIPVFEFAFIDEEGTYGKNRVYGTEDRVYMVSVYSTDTTSHSGGLLDSLLNSFHLAAGVKPARPRDPDEKGPLYWIIRAVASTGIIYGFMQYRKRRKNVTPPPPPETPAS